MLSNMGQNNSLPKPRRRSLRSPFVIKRNHKPSLSHTFSLPNSDQKVELLNINTASEEELMTLPGVTREIAKSIVKHRLAIGRFRKIEDLALVGGIGAVKLDKIRGEICVKNNSCCSSRAQSVDSLKSAESRFVTKTVEINKSSVFDLQCIHGMTQEMAANIVHHRSKKGPFKKCSKHQSVSSIFIISTDFKADTQLRFSPNAEHLFAILGNSRWCIRIAQVDDLLKVKSINLAHFSNMRHYFTIDDQYYNPHSNLIRTASASEVLSNGSCHSIPNGTSTPLRHRKVNPNIYRKTSSAPVKLHVANGLPSPSSLTDIFELLSAYSYRPIPEEDFKYLRNGRDAFRIATWNLDGFTLEKAQNLGVREVVCRTILENRWSIVCLQDVLEEEALELICEELNYPKLRKVAEFRLNSRDWQCTVLDSQLAFIYDISSGGLGVEVLSLKSQEVESYKAALAEFNVGLLTIQLLNIEIPDETNIEALEEKLIETTSTNKHLILLGDFTRLVTSDSSRLIGGLHSILPIHTNTGCASIKCKYSDNIFISNNLKSVLTGLWSIVRQGLTHLAIPNGWSWGGPVSPHCPLWTEIYVKMPIENGF